MATSKTQLRQSAVKAAAEITSAGLSAGLFGKTAKAIEDARTAFKQDREAIFADLVKVYEAEEAEAASAPPAQQAARRASTGSSSPNSGSITAEDALGTEFTWGAFKGLTIEQVKNLSASEAGEYGYPQANPGSKTGRQYIEWLAESKDDKTAFMARRAKLVIESMREAAA
jgi:hypothetical protein